MPVSTESFEGTTQMSANVWKVPSSMRITHMRLAFWYIKSDCGARSSLTICQPSFGMLVLKNRMSEFASTRPDIRSRPIGWPAPL